MSKKRAFVVYSPPMKGFPFLAVTLDPNGTAIASPFGTEYEAVAHIRELAAAHGHGTKH
ncbi:hypothetical protein FJ970_16145 [Mesorhizobium sp. B2-1-8]|uniref:hypothetical protein n=1 Tax=Mesorhizobium sp. B2-1-8 TaxID=2589967 RepID=UPI001D117D8D|nr:hypothetical protein [Mesorhizobium sp. B2-1-8]UCI16718.1 hypothetical protein FJ970_16145 [Mesorhizobium sp. B2-1-8]